MNNGSFTVNSDSKTSFVSIQKILSYRYYLRFKNRRKLELSLMETNREKTRKDKTLYLTKVYILFEQ